MYHAKEIRWTIFALCLLALLILLANTFGTSASLPSEGALCLGIPVVDLSVTQSDTTCSLRYGNHFLFQGEKAAFDRHAKTLYIPQQIDETTTRGDLIGELTISNANCQLYFLDDPAFDDLYAAVSEGHPFQLAVLHGRHTHVYSVVFTTLPVLRMDSHTQQEQDNGVPLYYGEMCLWEPGSKKAASSELTYHARGNTILWADKSSWKLSLKTDTGKNNHLSLLGLGKDDDWILNAMTMDDSKLKEKLMTTVWNGIAEHASWDYPMSTCEYVELVVNNSYCGLYLLQRRVDKKYLALSDSDILLKGMAMAEQTAFADAYAIKYSPLSDAETASLMEGVCIQQDLTSIDLQNFVDISILLQLGSAADNQSYTNMYYCLKKDGASYRLTMIPWDTDLTFGVTWLTDHNGYGYDVSLNQTVKRREYDQMAILHPELAEKLSQRWYQLRQDVLSTQNLLDILETQIGQLNGSGAYARDQAIWEPSHGGLDTQESVLRFVQERLTLLDAYYE